MGIDEGVLGCDPRVLTIKCGGAAHEEWENMHERDGAAASAQFCDPTLTLKRVVPRFGACHVV